MTYLELLPIICKVLKINPIDTGTVSFLITVDAIELKVCMNHNKEGFKEIYILSYSCLLYTVLLVTLKNPHLNATHTQNSVLDIHLTGTMEHNL
jgi:hypothetical protein